MQPKRRRLVAETADDLQHILFGDLEDEGAQAPTESEVQEQEQAIVPVSRPEPEDVEVYSDSDRDSMDEFIVRDVNEDREHRFIQNYSDRYGDDVAEGINDVMAIFGDLRILDIYSQGEGSRVKRIVDAKASLESQFDPEDVAKQLASSRDDQILSTDIPERAQEELGTAVCLNTVSAFELDPAALEAEWAAEAVWLYHMLNEQAATRETGAKDWTLWSPAKMEDSEITVTPIKHDHSALRILDYKTNVIERLHALLRDMKGRSMEPLFIWHSMAKAKYAWYLNLEDMLAAQTLDLEWGKLWAKAQHVDGRMQAALSELDEVVLNQPAADGDSDSVVNKSIQMTLAETAKQDLTSLITELRFLTSPEGVTVDFAEELDDIAVSFSAETEPIAAFVNVSKALVPTVSSPSKVGVKRIARGAAAATGSSSSVATIIHHKLHETLMPVLSLAPKEVGDNLWIGAKIHKGPFAGTASPRLDQSVLTPALRAAVIEYLASTISANARVRRWIRREYRARATVFTHPLGPLNAAKRLYAIRRLAGKPVKEFFGTEVFLGVQSLVAMNEVQMDLVLMVDDRVVAEACPEIPASLEEAVYQHVIKNQPASAEDVDPALLRHCSALKAYKEKSGYSVSRVSDVLVDDSLYVDILRYLTPETNAVEDEWVQELRGQVAKSVMGKLYKSLKTELMGKLLKDAYSVGAKKAGEAFSQLIRMKPFVPTVYGNVETLAGSSRDERLVRESVRRSMGLCSVMGVVVEKLSNGFRMHCVVVGHRGDVQGHIALDQLLTTGSEKKDADRARITDMIKRHTPALIVVGVDDRKAKAALGEVKWIADSIDLGDLAKPKCELADLAVPSRIAKMSGYKIENLAASLARFQQSPLAETLQLWSDVSVDKNQALTVPVHDLQAFIPKQLLEREFFYAAQFVVAMTGVDINDAIASASRRTVVKFVPGLGPRKARHLLEAADAHIRGLDGGEKESRLTKLERILGSRVFRNAQPFLRLVPDCDKVAVTMMHGPSVTRRYSEDSIDDASSSSDSSDDSSDSDSAAAPKERDSYGDSWKSQTDKWYFGVPNAVVASVLEGYEMLQLCRMARDCYPVATGLFERSIQPDDVQQSLFMSLGDSSTFDKVEAFDSTAFVEEMFDSASLPSYLTDVDLWATKTGAKTAIASIIVPQLEKPFHAIDGMTDWRAPTQQRLFYATIRESESELNKFTVSVCNVVEDKEGWYKLSDGTLEGPLKSANWTKLYIGDSVRARVSEIDFAKSSVTFTTDPLSESDQARFLKWSPFMVPEDADFAAFASLGKVTQIQKQVVKSRRIIKHESFFEIPHAAAVERLAQAPIGDVVFRPSSSQPGQYLGMIKFMGTADSKDPSKEDWIKTFRFMEGPSAKTANKTVFKLLDSSEEFEEFDQIKVLYVDKYLRYLAELRAHAKFRPEHIEQVTNMIKAKMRTGQSGGAVVYFLVMDTRRELAGNAVLLWASDASGVHEDVIEITNRGFKWWGKGPYPSLNQLLNWWKQGGYNQRNMLRDEWRNQRTK